MVDFEKACQGIDSLVEEYISSGNSLVVTRKMFDYVNSLAGEAGLHKQKLIRDYFRRIRIIDNLSLYDRSVPQADGDNTR